MGPKTKSVVDLLQEDNFLDLFAVKLISSFNSLDFSDVEGRLTIDVSVGIRSKWLLDCKEESGKS